MSEQYKELASVGLQFLDRVDCKGAESEAIAGVRQMLREIFTGSLQVTPPPPPPPPPAVPAEPAEPPTE